MQSFGITGNDRVMVLGSAHQTLWLLQFLEPRVGKHRHLLRRLLAGNSDANIGFDALRAALRSLGFAEHIRGSHHIFQRADVTSLINLQRDRAHAKAYQVRQVRRVLEEMGIDEDEL